MRRGESLFRCASLLLLIGGALCLASCKSTDGAAKGPSSRTIGAQLRSLGGTVTRGVVSFRAYDGGVVMYANIGGVTFGKYRIVIHTNPNCTSPNGFSAGPPLQLADASGPVAVTVQPEGSEGTIGTTQRIAGVTLDSIDGKAVVVHDGATGSLEATPGVRNNRMACGVIGPITPLSF